MTESFFGGAPALSFKDQSTRGVARGGVVVDEPRVTAQTKMGTGELLTWPDGSTKEQMIVTLLCDGSAGGRDERDPHNPADVGKRRLYIKGYMIAAVREALQKVGATGLQQGGVLLVAWVDEKPSKTHGNHDAKLYASVYTQPSVSVPRGGESVPQSGLSGQPAPNPFGGQPATPAAQQVPQQPAAQQGGYDPNAYRAPAATQPQQPAPNPFGGQPAAPPAQPVPTGPPANPFG